MSVERHLVGDLRFQVRRTKPASETAPSFVLIHGLGMSHRSLARLHRELEARGAVFSITLPGFGGLRKPRHTISVAEMAAAIAVLLDRMIVRQAVLVGQSMGTQWAVELAAQRPDLASHVVVIGPVVDDRHRSLPAQMVALAADSIRETPRINALVLADYWRCGPLWYLRQARQMVRYRIEHRARTLDMPLLIVHGARDRIASRTWCRRLHTITPRSTVVRIPDAAHHAQFSAPRAVAAAMTAHISAR